MNEGAFATDAVPAATVILLRDAAGGLETLMLRRNSKLAFAGGAWVFPGGRVDPEDFDPTRPDDEQATARNAAAREAREEAGLQLDPDDFVVMSRWCPPPEAPRRFNTWFFVAAAPDGEVVVDGGEIREHAWLAPAEALRLRAAGEAEIIPPTWVTLLDLSGFASVHDALETIGARRSPDVFVTRSIKTGDGRRVLLWAGDDGYADGRVEHEGALHRLWLDPTDWRYQRTFDDRLA
jgi:8-oxo-dGTP pyrophosphatase MutT (NUDIX family)